MNKIKYYIYTKYLYFLFKLRGCTHYQTEDILDEVRFEIVEHIESGEHTKIRRVLNQFGIPARYVKYFVSEYMRYR